jgi:hypothetical protein
VRCEAGWGGGLSAQGSYSARLPRVGGRDGCAESCPEQWVLDVTSAAGGELWALGILHAGDTANIIVIGLGVE